MWLLSPVEGPRDSDKTTAPRARGTRCSGHSVARRGAGTWPPGPAGRGPEGAATGRPPCRGSSSAQSGGSFPCLGTPCFPSLSLMHSAPPPRAPRKHGPSTQEGVQVCTGAGPPRRPPWSFQPKIPISFSFPLFLWTQKKWIHHINTCHLGRCGRHGPNPFLPPQGKFQSRTSLSPASEQGVSGVIRRHPGQRAGQAVTQSASAGTPGARRPP